MKIRWQPQDLPEPITLGDDSVRHTIMVGDFGGQVLVQSVPLVRGAHPFVKDRGNVSGVFSFTATKSHADVDAALEAMADAYQLLSHNNGCRGTLTWERASTIATFQNAVLQSVQKAVLDGVRLSINYTFLIKGVEAGLPE